MNKSIKRPPPQKKAAKPSVPPTQHETMVFFLGYVQGWLMTDELLKTDQQRQSHRNRLRTEISRTTQLLNKLNASENHQ